MTVTVGRTSPIQRTSRRSEAAGKRSRAAAKLGAVLRYSAALATGAAAAFPPCRAVEPPPAPNRRSYSTHPYDAHGSLEVPFELHPTDQPCLSDAAEAVEEELARRRLEWVHEHAMAGHLVSCSPVLVTSCSPSSDSAAQAEAAMPLDSDPAACGEPDGRLGTRARALASGSDSLGPNPNLTPDPDH